MVWLTNEEREQAQRDAEDEKIRFANANGNFVAMSAGARGVKIDLPRKMTYSELIEHARSLGHDFVRGAYDNKGFFHARSTKIDF